MNLHEKIAALKSLPSLTSADLIELLIAGSPHVRYRKWPLETWVQVVEALGFDLLGTFKRNWTAAPAERGEDIKLYAYARPDGFVLSFDTDDFHVKTAKLTFQTGERIPGLTCESPISGDHGEKAYVGEDTLLNPGELSTSVKKLEGKIASPFILSPQSISTCGLSSLEDYRHQKVIHKPFSPADDVPLSDAGAMIYVLLEENERIKASPRWFQQMIGAESPAQPVNGIERALNQPPSNYKM